MAQVPDGTAEPVRFELLGALRAWRGEQELDLGPGKQRAVLAVLLLNANRAVATGDIIDAVWRDDPPENGANVVQKYVAGLRRVLEPDRSPRGAARTLRLTDAGYLLSVDAGCLDVEVFRDRVRRARGARAGGDLAGAADGLRSALAGWQEQALGGVAGAFADAARARLGEERVAVLEDWIEIRLDLGEHAAVVSELTRLVAEFPLREQLRGLLMLALYRCGRQAEALAEYRAARDHLVAEFGVEPGEHLRELHGAILRSDPSLAAPPPAQSTQSAEATQPTRPTRPTRSTQAAVPDAPAAPAPGDATTSGAHEGTGTHGVADVGAARPGGTGGSSRADGDVGTDATGAPAGEPVTVTGVAGSFAATALGGSVSTGSVARTGERLGWGAWLARCALVLTPLLSFGMLTWAAFTVLAARRRSVALWCSVAGYVGLLFAVFMLVDTTTEKDTFADWQDALGALAWLLSCAGGAAHAAVLAPGVGRPRTAQGRRHEKEGTARDRREQALLLLYHHPDLARELCIGRPDLPRHFDDGGLVDINGAPPEVLAGVPGLSTDQAQWIVVDRAHSGPFGSVDELLMRGPFRYPLDPALRERLVAVAPPPPPPPPPARTGTQPQPPGSDTGSSRPVVNDRTGVPDQPKRDETIPPNRPHQTPHPANPAGAAPSATTVSVAKPPNWPVPPN